MMRRFRTNPLDHEPDQKLTFDDVTALVFAGMLTLGVMFLIGLGARCATHRLERVLYAHEGFATPDGGWPGLLAQGPKITISE